MTSPIERSPGGEDVIDQPALVRGQRLVRGDQAAQLFLADRFAAGVRVTAEQADEHVGRLGQQPDDRTEDAASRFSGGANSRRGDSARCSASRLGASSPRTSVTNEMISVTPMMPVAPARPLLQPCWTRKSLASSDSVTAPNALDSSAVEVTPIWTAARKRFGSLISLATAAPRRPGLGQRAHLALAQRDQGDLGRDEEPSMMISTSTMPTLSSVCRPRAV